MLIRRKMFTSRSPRRAFTLLEVVLAVSVGLVLVIALYSALYVQFQHGRVAREIIEETNIVQAILTKITSDIGPIQAPVNPFLNASNALSNSTAPPMSGSSSSTSMQTTNANPIAVTVTNLGVQGNDSCVVFSVSRAARELAPLIGNGDTLKEPVCDLRRITYCYVEGEGLVRKEDSDVTSQTNAPPVEFPPALGDVKAHVIAPQVTSLKIRYYGSTGWVNDWDGSTQVAAAVPSNSAATNPVYTQQGPPALIEFTLKFGKQREITVQHCVAVPTANRVVAASPAGGTPP